MAGWVAYFQIKDMVLQNRFDEQAMSIIEGVGHAFGGDGELDFKKLFPRYDFQEPDGNKNSKTESIAASNAVGAALGMR